MVEYGIRDFQELVQSMIAEPYSDEGQEVIHNDSTHVGEIWEDAEITSTKSGDLYRQRSLHQRNPPLLPKGVTLFDVPEEDDHKRMVIVDDILNDIVDNMTVKVSIDRQFRKVVIEVDDEVIDDG